MKKNLGVRSNVKDAAFFKRRRTTRVSLLVPAGARAGPLFSRHGRRATKGCPSGSSPRAEGGMVPDPLTPRSRGTSENDTRARSASTSSRTLSTCTTRTPSARDASCSSPGDSGGATSRVLCAADAATSSKPSPRTTSPELSEKPSSRSLATTSCQVQRQGSAAATSVTPCHTQPPCLRRGRGRGRTIGRAGFSGRTQPTLLVAHRRRGDPGISTFKGP